MANKLDGVILIGVGGVYQWAGLEIFQILGRVGSMGKTEEYGLVTDYTILGR